MLLGAITWSLVSGEGGLVLMRSLLGATAARGGAGEDDGASVCLRLSQGPSERGCSHSRDQAAKPPGIHASRGVYPLHAHLDTCLYSPPSVGCQPACANICSTSCSSCGLPCCAALASTSCNSRGSCRERGEGWLIRIHPSHCSAAFPAATSAIQVASTAQLQGQWAYL
jgi:hypothetical protein